MVQTQGMRIKVFLVQQFSQVCIALGLFLARHLAEETNTLMCIRLPTKEKSEIDAKLALTDAKSDA